MPEYSLDTHLDISCGLFSFIAFLVAIVTLYYLEISTPAKLGLFIGGIIVLKILSRREQQALDQ